MLTTNFPDSPISEKLTNVWHWSIYNKLNEYVHLHRPLNKLTSEKHGSASLTIQRKDLN